MPGLVTRIRDPPRMLISISSVSTAMTASVKSSVTSHHDGRSSNRQGTTQRPVR